MKKVLIIDNYDSFTYILKQYFGQLNANPQVFLNDHISVEQIKQFNPTHLVLSPGPGTVETPKDVGITFEALKAFQGHLPILGVCLGHQAIGKYFGGRIESAPKVMHGKRSQITHSGAGIFKGISSPFEAMRYHSLCVRIPRDHSQLEVTARSEDGVVMGLQHKTLPIYGVQFHPESLGTPEGMRILQTFLQ